MVATAMSRVNVNLRRLEEWLLREYPADLIMPVKSGTKQPVKAHKNGKWTWEEYRAFMSLPKDVDIGILLRDLCVVDFDDVDTALSFEKAFPELLEAPTEVTRKGRHYFFRRPDYADAEGYYDGARQHSELPVDFKSVCSTGTSGLIVVCPSSNKSWVRPPWMHAPQEISRALLSRVAAGFPPPKSKKQLSLSSPGPSPGPNPGPSRVLSAGPSRRLQPDIEEVLQLLALLARGRADSYETWVQVGWCLHNIAGCSSDASRLLTAWKDFSKLSSKYKEGECQELWPKMADEGLGLGTLHMWAKQDSPYEYKGLVGAVGATSWSCRSDLMEL
ncbi:putative helicase [Tetrabaena socialis]|uniref:Putative helicase n=1 Tax=Tetrabaena socialis TaxID=47790 RepID=A0A2J7ZMQ7_9CHLO|nr:putative helicase [Tetrabaena socialis]|eukprot:PNH01554.1 putative helicase [Tetrabaena socialis]